MAIPSRKPPFNVPVEIDTIILDGGLDQVTPLETLPAGVAREALNFEVSVTGGYATIQGYERFDGQPNPSDATAKTLVLSAVGATAVGDKLHGLTSGAIAYVAAIVGLEVTVTKQTADFSIGESVKDVTNAVVIGTVTSLFSADTSALHAAQAVYAAAELYRADILPVPGAGPVHVMRLNGVVYAMRNTVDNAEKKIWQSTAAGWVKLNLGNEIYFNTGVSQIFDGDTITDAITGSTGVVARVVLQSGSWAAGTAAGKLIISSHTGIIGAGHALQEGGVTHATATTGLQSITISPGGRLETDTATFGGAFNGQRIYGADGVSRGFEFDGTNLVPIDTGLGVLDKPTHVAAFKNSLFFSYGSSVQFSGLGTPYIWTPLFGAGEIAMNGNVTNFQVQSGSQLSGAMVIYSADQVSILYGNNSSDFQLTMYNQQFGAQPYTSQNLEDAYALDARGVMKMSTTLNYGNFDQSTLTANILPFIKAHRGRSLSSCVSHDKSQYRVFFSDGWALYCTIVNGQVKGCMPVWTPDAFFTAVSGEQNSSTDAIYVGSASTGYVYRLDAGTSFDGGNLPFSLLLTYADQGNSRLRKKYRRASLQVNAAGFTKLNVGFDYGFSDTVRQDMQAPVTYNKNPISANWDAGNWDALVWDGRSLGPLEVSMGGTSENVATRIQGQHTFSVPFTFNSIRLHWSPRRLMR